MTGAFDLSDALLSVTWQTIGTHQVLAVFDDRSAWYWALATTGQSTPGPRSDVVGSFRVDVPADRLSAVTAVAAVVAELETEPVRGGLGITVGSGRQLGWAALGTDQAGRIADAVLPLVALALAHPVAAARLQTRLVTSPIGRRLAGFTLASIGTQPVAVRLDPEQFALALTSGDWSTLPAPRMGLVDAAGALLDGLYTTAEIPPGALGVCTIVLDDPTAGMSPDGGAMRAAIRGSLTLAGPWPVAPIEAFEASSKALAVVIP